MDERISWFPIAQRASLAPETRAIFDQVEEKLGFVPTSSSLSPGAKTASISGARTSRT